MDRAQVAESLELFLAERGRPLLRAAVLLTGSQQDGEDLLQAALERLLKHWRTVQAKDRTRLRGSIGRPVRVVKKSPVSIQADPRLARSAS